jgi:hypothetical protein
MCLCPKRIPSYRWRWIGGIIVVAIRLRGRGNRSRQHTARVKVPALGLGRGWPVSKIAPLVCPQNKQSDRSLAHSTPVAFHMGTQPGRCLLDQHRAACGLEVCPGTNKQRGVSSRRAQGLVIPELPVQEEIVPATHEIDRCRDLCETGTEVDWVPVVGVLLVQHHVLEGVGGLVNGGPVSLPERQILVRQS